MPRPRVVVVDDDEDNAQLLAAALEGFGFATSIARSCQEAKAALEGAPADALVTDFALGDGNALELLSSIGPRRPRVAIVVSGYGSSEDKERSTAAGFHAHLVKPIALDELEKVLREALAA